MKTGNTRADKAARWAKQAADPDAASMRRVGWRLAGLTVGLLMVLLLALGAVVYGTTRYMLMQSLQSTLVSRANTVAPRFTYLQPGTIFGGQDGPGGMGGSPYDPNRNGDGVFVVVADTNLNVISGDGPNGAALSDSSAAQAVLNGTTQNEFSTQQIDTNGPYLIYSKLLTSRDGTIVLGVLQASISEQQYLSELHFLLAILVGVSIAGLLASGAISAVLARRALRPIQVSMRRQRDFVADAAHELRTPLAIMRTAAELGLADGSPQEQQVALEQTLSQSTHLARLVDSLSLLARADSGVVTLEREPVSVSELARSTVEGVEILAEEREVTLQLSAQPDVYVMGDAGRLRQLLLIMLDNALKHTPEQGTITVHVDRKGPRARIGVRDSGPGIDPKDLPHLFDRFYRADRARSSEGTGLGLAIGRWIAEAHGGQIMAANAKGGGALFVVTLPAVQKPPAQANAAPDPADQPVESAAPS
jgi:signal transduction histidine kinase